MYNRIGKRLRISLAVTVIALVGLFGAQTGEAQTMASLPAPMTPAETLGDARALLAWIDFCRRHPSECTVDTSEPAVVALTPRTWQTIVSINRKVNATIKPMTDLEHWSVADRWFSRMMVSAIARTTSFSSASCSPNGACLAAPCA
jgi:predicted transglutaminase-like cysteine proteinase